MRKFITLFLAFAVVIAAAGCGKKAETKGEETLRFMYWGDVSEIKIIKEQIAKFTEKTGVKVKAERAPSGPSYMEKVLTQFAGGAAPDVLFVEVNNFKKLAQKGVLQDLSPHVAANPKLNIKDFYPQIIDRFTIDNKLYVLPRDIAPICVVYYNKEIFDAAGQKYPKSSWNWFDMIRVSKKVMQRDANGKVEVFGFVDDWPLWESFVFSNGGSLVDDTQNATKCTLDEKEAIQAIQFRSDLIHKYGIMPSPSQMTAMGGMGTSDMFVSGRVAMFYSGIWKTPSFRKIKSFGWDVVMFPKGPKGLRGFPTGGSGYSITRDCEKPELAFKLISYLSGEEGQKKLAETGLAQPAMIHIAESKAFLDGRPPKNKRVVLEGVKYAEFMPLTRHWENINVGMIAPAFDRIWAGKQSAREVLTDLVPQINQEYFSEE